MPMYEYQCQECGHQFEVRQKFSDAPVETCTECGGPVKKLISQGGFALKGGGWFDQGYGSGGGCTAPKNAGCGGCPKAAS